MMLPLKVRCSAEVQVQVVWREPLPDRLLRAKFLNV